MIEFNLLPWREAQRREQKRLFNGLLVLSALCGLMVVLIVSGINAAQVSTQQSRNTLLQSENKVLDNRLLRNQRSASGYRCPQGQTTCGRKSAIQSG
jgi:type IV pilus assembly protein PilN